MPAIHLVTDTDASLPTDLETRYSIIQVPVTVHFGEETYRSNLDLDDVRLFARIDREKQLPTTSAPSPGAFIEAFERSFQDGAKSVICFCVSSEVSATYSAALTACQSLPSRDISVIDTRSLSMSQGFIVLAAAEAIAAGASKEEAIARALDVRDRTYLFAALSTVKYLAMSGRVGSIAAGMASLLNVKPVLTIRNGKLDMLERVRTQTKSWKRTLELTSEALAGRPIERLAIIHVAAKEAALRFEALARKSLPCPDQAILAELTPGLSVHSGAGLVGLVVVAVKRTIKGSI